MKPVPIAPIPIVIHHSSTSLPAGGRAPWRSMLARPFARVILATWSRQLRGTPRRRSMPMKITSVETIELSHRLNRPTGPASVLNETRSTLIVRIATDEGLIGWGETSPLDGVRETIMGTYANALRGRDPLDAGRVWRTPWLPPFECGLAAGAVDIGLQELGVYWYEEPLPQAGYHGYEVLAANLDMAIAGGEMLQTRAAFKELLDRRAVDIVQPDVSICGGIADLLFVADLARLYGIQA